MRSFFAPLVTLLASAFLLLLSQSCWADLYQVTVVGTISSVDNSAGFLDDSVQVGSPFTYTWFYNTDAPPTDNIGQTAVQNGIFGETVICGDYTLKPGFPQFVPGVAAPTYAIQDQVVSNSDDFYYSLIGFASGAVAESSRPNAPLLYAATDVFLFYPDLQLSLTSLPPLSVYNTFDPDLGGDSGSMGVSVAPQNGDHTQFSYFLGSVDSVSALPVVNPNAVLLVHGIWGSASNWGPSIASGVYSSGMKINLQDAGYNVEAVDFPTEAETMSNVAPIEDQAKALSRRIGTLMNDSFGQNVDLVCHSMGGLAARYYLEHPELWQKDAAGNVFPGVYKLIMIGTPNWGVDTNLLNPVGEVARSHSLTLPQSQATDQYFSFSAAMQEMFSEWEPAPDEITLPNGLIKYGYPKDFALTKWPMNRGTPFSPIPRGTYSYADYVVSLFSSDSTSAAIGAAEHQFPSDNLRECTNNQEINYAQQAQQLGVPYYDFSGSYSPVHGVGFRYVSPFLVSLNTTVDYSGVNYYLIAGDDPTAFNFITIIPLPSHPFVTDISVPGPFSPSLRNDGAVPVDCVFGNDPINGQSLFPYLLLSSDNLVDEVVLHVDHHNEPANSSVISQVEQWLAQ